MDMVKINDSDDLYGIMQKILLRDDKIDRGKEHFWVIGMNQTRVILYIELVRMGSEHAKQIEPMNVYRVAVQKDASRVITVHNHPANTMLPSEHDKDITDRLIQVGKILGINMEDHMIISPDTYTSFRNIGLMAELEKSSKYAPNYQMVQKIRATEEEMREEVLRAERVLRDEAVRAERILREEADKDKHIAERERKEAERGKVEAEKRLMIAVHRLMEQQMTVDQIAEILGLTTEEIRQMTNK